MPAQEQFEAFTPSGQFPRCAAQCPLLAEVNHRTANQFAVLTSYIHLSLEEFLRQPGEIRDLQLAFAAVESRAQALASLNRRLMNRSRSDELVDVSHILHDICAAFSGRGARHQILDEVTANVLVTSTVNVAIGQIVTEALMNALKYAYPHDQAGEITVRTALKPGGLLIEVVDRGVGGPPSLAAAAKSFGVRLMLGLARQENIGLSFVAGNPGLSVQCLAPLAEGQADVGRPSVY